MTLIPILETDRLFLRPFQPEDADAYYRQIGGDSDVMRYLRGGQPITRADMPGIILRRLAYWEEHGFGLWAVTEKASAAFIGQCGLHWLDKTDEIEIAYALGKAYWGKGLATEAGAAVLRYGFEVLKLERITAVAVAENTASQRVMVKLGMRYERVAQVYGDELPYYALNRADFQPGTGFYRLIQD